jgi:ACYPI45536 protein
MYANIKNGCQSYFICHSGRKDNFVCPQGTLFSEDLMTCDYWYRVKCASRFNSANELTSNSHSEPVYPQTTVQEQDHDYDLEYLDQHYEPEPPSYYPDNYDIHYNTRPVTSTVPQTIPTTSNLPTTSSLEPTHNEPELTTSKPTDRDYSTVNPDLDYNYYYPDYNYEEPEWTFAWIRKPKLNQSESSDEQRTRQNFEFDLTNQLLNPKLKEVGNKETSNAPNPWLFSRPRK